MKNFTEHFFRCKLLWKMMTYDTSLKYTDSPEDIVLSKESFSENYLPKAK